MYTSQHLQCFLQIGFRYCHNRKSIAVTFEVDLHGPFQKLTTVHEVDRDVSFIPEVFNARDNVAVGETGGITLGVTKYIPAGHM